MNENNGNGHVKPFGLAPVKSAAELEREKLSKMAPALRREASRDRSLSVGAKWLFSTLADNTFYEKYGGDSQGRVSCSLADLARIYGHHKDSLSKWKAELISARRIWFDGHFYKSVFGIMGLCHQPELLPPHAEQMRHASQWDHPPKSSTPPTPTAENEDLGRNNTIHQPDPPNLPEGKVEDLGRIGLNLRPDRPNLPDDEGGQTSPHRPNLPDSKAEDLGRSRRIEPSGVAGETAHIKESLGSKGALESKTFKRSTGERAKSGGGKDINAENHFLLEVGAMMERWKKGSSKLELKNSGAWWRLAYRADAGLMRRVFADVCESVKTGTITKTPGHAAAFRWSDWGGPCVAAPAPDVLAAAPVGGAK